MWISRRTALVAGAAALLAPTVAWPLSDWAWDLEKRSGGRLGVAALDTGSGRSISHRARRRFPTCSTFKLLLAGAILHRVDTGSEQLDRQIVFSQSDLVFYSPATEAHVAEGRMSVAALCSAIIVESDNTAANLLLRAIGGPEGLNSYCRTLGDQSTWMRRWEPELNTAIQGDDRDTSTPLAMVRNLQKLTLGDALSPSSRDMLVSWMVASPTGLKRIRAGIPASWRAGDKTGTGYNGTANDVAVLWPPSRAPIIVAAYYTMSILPEAARSDVLAEVGRKVAEQFA